MVVQGKPPTVRKTVIATANYHITLAGIALAGGGLKDAEEIRLLKEVLRLLKVRVTNQGAAQ